MHTKIRQAFGYVIFLPCDNQGCQMRVSCDDFSADFSLHSLALVTTAIQTEESRNPGPIFLTVEVLP